MIEQEIGLAPRIALAAGIAFVVLVTMELIAYFEFDESPANRNAFGYSADAGISVERDVVSIAPTSSRRFWQQKYPRTAPPGVKRIIVVGDSAVRGPSLDASLTQALQDALAKHGGIQAEVWNLSSPGYGSQRKALIMQRALEFAPDLIVYHAGITTEYEDAREWERYLAYHSWHPRHWIDQLPFLGRARLAKLERGYWQMLPESVRADSNEDPLAVRLAAIVSKQDTAFWLPRMLSTLDGTIAQAVQARVPIILVTHVIYDASMRTMKDFGLDQALVERYASQPGVTVLANREVFAKQPDVAALFADSSHWTDAGKDALAAALALEVKRIFRKGG